MFNFIEVMANSQIVSSLSKEDYTTLMYVQIGDECMIKGEAFDWLDSLTLAWDDDANEIIITKDTVFAPLSDSAHEHFRLQGVDMSGSPGTEEQFIVNMLGVTYPFMPITLASQLLDLMAKGHNLRGFFIERKIGAVFQPDGTGRFTEGGAIAHQKGKFNVV